MLELPHTLVGATIASYIPNPLISLPLAFASHLLVDLIPHWNPQLVEETERWGKPSKNSTIFVITDVLLSLISGFFIASRFLPDLKRAVVVILACFLAVFIDTIEGFYFFLGLRSKFFKKLIYFQNGFQNKLSPLPGILTQILLVFICFYLTLSR